MTIKKPGVLSNFPNNKVQIKVQNFNFMKLHSNRTNHEIANALIRDDQEFFSAIYDNYSPFLLGMIMKWVKEKETAELMLYHAFIKAWHCRKMFDSKNEIFYYWLCRQARICYTESLVSA